MEIVRGSTRALGSSAQEKGYLALNKHSSILFYLQVFKLEGAFDRYLFVEPGYLNWCIYPSLQATRDYIQSGSCGQPCPAHPRNKRSDRGDNYQDWSFDKAREDSEPDWEEGGIIVRCSVHDYQQE